MNPKNIKYCMGSGKPMIDHIIGQLNRLAIEKTILVVGHQKEALKGHLSGQVDFVEQEEQLLKPLMR